MLSDLSKTDSYNIGNLKNRVSEKHFLAAAKVNFMCHLGWAMGCPGIWSNTVLRVSVKVVLDDINIEIRLPRWR